MKNTHLPTIGLSMIVKNEEKVILRMLNSVHHILDHYTVVDTGSTDKTKELIRNFFAEKNIPGEIDDHPWVNFEDARNFALEKSKDKTDFSFVISASNELILSPDFNKDKLKYELSQTDVGMMNVDTGGSEKYGQLSFWRNSKPFYYFGATHEVLLCKEPYLSHPVNDIYVKLNSDGKSWEDGKLKFWMNIKLLKEYIEKNGPEPRHVFYLAQSYKDVGEYKAAIEWYEKRLEIKGGFHEELYYSQLMIAGLKWEHGYPVMEVADEYMRCGEIDLLRAEHLYFLKQMYERNKRPQCAIKIGELLERYAGKNPYPERHLFLNPKAYEFQAEQITK